MNNNFTAIPSSSDSNMKEEEVNDPNKNECLPKILNFNGDYLSQMLTKIQKLSQHSKKIKIDEDPDYYLSQSKEYAKLIKRAKAKIENIIGKTMLFTSKNIDDSMRKDIGKK
jgi:hypothetical protein